MWIVQTLHKFFLKEYYKEDKSHSYDLLLELFDTLIPSSS